jgi:hypothetical protein
MAKDPYRSPIRGAAPPKGGIPKPSEKHPGKDLAEDWKRGFGKRGEESACGEEFNRLERVKKS